jgi:hypothetical protein
MIGEYPKSNSEYCTVHKPLPHYGGTEKGLFLPSHGESRKIGEEIPIEAIPWPQRNRRDAIIQGHAMPETFQQYRKRTLGYLESMGNRDPIKIQKATPAKLERLIKGVPRKELLRRPARGKWSVLEILGHLADAELAIAWRLRIILARSGAPLLWFDQDIWARKFRYQTRDPRQLLDLFHAIRQSNLELLKSIPRREWGRCYGIHELRGRQSVADFVQMEAAHDLNHLRQIEDILGR